ncbi:MAG: hypothetical protein JO138_05320 [Acidobacteriaceae bacterium]|nr:hypothetical protein [Acidobacteriaceae bacterium]
MPRKQRTNPEQIRAEIHKLTEGGKVRKMMACGHDNDVYANVDATREVCWACPVEKGVRTAPVLIFGCTGIHIADP